MFARVLRTLPPSAIFVFYVLDQYGPLPRYQLLTETMLADRTLGYALKILYEKGLVKRTTAEVDGRVTIYSIPSPLIILESK